MKQFVFWMTQNEHSGSIPQKVALAYGKKIQKAPITMKAVPVSR